MTRVSDPVGARLRWSFAIAVVMLTLGVPGAIRAQAAATGTIAGRVFNESTEEPQPGVRITLNGADTDGGGRVRLQATTDRRGRFEFADLATGPDRYYTIDATYDGGFFAGGAVTLPDNTSKPPVIQTTLKVWETTTDPRSILIRRDDIFAIPAEQGGIGIIEAVTIVNQRDRAYIGRASRRDRDEGTPSLAFALPEGAYRGGITIVEADLDIPGIVEVDGGFAATIAIPPGTFRTTFSYSLPDPGGTSDLSRVALYPTLELNVLAAPPLEVRSNRLEPDEEVSIGTDDDRRSYRKWSAPETLDAGDPVQVIVVAAAGSGPGVYGAVAVAIALVLGLAAIVAGRTFGRRRSRASTEAPVEAVAREQTLTSIAELDIRHDAGQISDDEWAARRASLKARLVPRPVTLGMFWRREKQGSQGRREPE